MLEGRCSVLSEKGDDNETLHWENVHKVVSFGHKRSNRNLSQKYSTTRQHLTTQIHCPHVAWGNPK